MSRKLPKLDKDEKPFFHGAKMNEIPEQFRTQKRRKVEGWKEEVTEKKTVISERMEKGVTKVKRTVWKVVTLTKEFLCPYCQEEYMKQRRAVFENGKIVELERGNNRYDKLHNMYTCGLKERKKEFSITKARICSNCKSRSKNKHEVRKYGSSRAYVCERYRCEVDIGYTWGESEVCPKHCFKGEEWENGKRVKS